MSHRQQKRTFKLSPLSLAKLRSLANWWQRMTVGLVVLVLLFVATTYGVARWYIATHANQPLKLGVTFIPNYASYLGVDPKKTMDALIQDVGVRNFRLVSYWEDIEPAPGKYDFSSLDWQFQKAQAAGASVSLSIGLRQPRWPECHQPSWVAGEPKSVWYPQLKNVMAAVINRYKNNPALKSYQLENEYFLKVFGKCTDFDRNRLVDEYNYVKSLDPKTTLIVSRSNNDLGIPIGKPQPDEFGVSVYKRVWDRTLTHRYFEFPFPAWYYASFAGWGKIFTGKDIVIHELQAEPWLPDGFDMRTAPLSEQNKSMNAGILKTRFGYAKATGIRDIDFWGAEWWYFRKVKLHDSSVWDVARQEFKNSNK